MISRKTSLARTIPHRRFRPWRMVTSRAKSAVPAGFLGMIALVAVVEIGIARAGSRFVDPIGYCWSFSARAARAQGPGSEVLYLGDSLVKHGLVPRALDQVTGRRSYNLATAANPVPITHIILRRALDAGARPSAVVFDLNPGLLVGGPEYSVRSFSGVLNPIEMFELARSRRSRAFATELVLNALLSSFRSRHEIRSDLLAALRGESAPLRAMNAVIDRNWTVNRGANLATPRPGYTGDVSEAEHDKHLSRSFRAHRVNVEYARRLVALTSERAIATYLLIPPSVPQLTERRRQTGAEEKYERFVRSLQDRFPGLTVLDARESGYPPSVFIDPIHLDARGAWALSLDVGAVLRNDRNEHGERSSNRWVTLPRYRERPLPADLEDVEQSRARIGLSKIP